MNNTRTIVFIDPNATVSSPAMKSIIASLPFFLKSGATIEFWCREASQDLPREVLIKKLPLNLPLPAPFYYWWFSLIATTLALAERHLLARGKKTYISTSYYFPRADLNLIHFSNVDWLKRQFSAPIRSWREIFRILLNIEGTATDIFLARASKKNSLIAVSTSVAADFRSLSGKKKTVKILPNAYEGDRFNPLVREKYRIPTRSELGIPEAAFVFAFTSLGHYRRKGLDVAIAALQALREKRTLTNIEICFLIIGGSEGTLQEIQKQLLKKVFDWKEWIFFTGMTKNVPKLLSAADALLFPSHSEAFSLAEIEAAAMGISLYLTPHHGSEMILLDGVNGRSISWDPTEIANTLEEDILQNKVHSRQLHTHLAICTEEYANRLHALITKAIIEQK